MGMGRARIGCLKVGVAACLLLWASFAQAAERNEADAAYIKRFGEANPQVKPRPSIEDYVSPKLYDTRYLGESLKAYRAKYGSNEKGGLAWGLTGRMRSLNEMFRATGDAKYLRANLECVRGILAQRDDRTGVRLWTGETAPAWSCTKYAKRGRAVFPVHTGLIVYVSVDCLGLIQSDAPAVYAELGEEYETLVKDLLEAVAWHDRQWRDGPGEGEGHYVGLNQEEVLENKPLPGNRLSAMGLALWRSWEITGNQVHRDRARAMGRYIKRRLSPAPDGAYYWPYYLPAEPVKEPAARETVKGEDISHGALTALFPIMLANAGEVFDEADKQRLANTFLQGLGRLGDGVILADVTGDASKKPCYAGACARWLPVAPYDSRVYPAIAEYFLRYVPKPEPLDTALLLRFKP